MTWTAPRTWVTGEVVLAATMDEQVRDNELDLYAPVRSMLPVPVQAATAASAGVALAANDTVAHGGAIIVPNPITVNKILYHISGASGGLASTIIIALYTEDGQVRVINDEDAVDGNVGVREIDITDTYLEAGVYYFLIAHGIYDTSAKLVTRYTHDTTLQAHIANEPDLSGTLTIAAGVMPATFDPTALTTVAGAMIPVIRFLGLAT